MAISGTNARWDIINARTDVLSYSNWGTRGIGGGSIMILRMNWVAALAANPQGKPTTYVPNELLDDYRGASNWSSLRSKIHGFFDMPPIIIKDGTYTMTLRDIFEDYSDLQVSMVENDYLTLSVEDDVMTITASGITSSTDTTVAISYSFAYRGSTISGTINLPVLYKEIIEFEDAEAKRICVANWGGEYCASTNKYGMKGEITMEQAAAVTTIGTAFKNNTLITSLKELKYFRFTSLQNDETFRGSSNITVIEFPSTLGAIYGFPFNYRKTTITLVFHSISVPTYSGSKTSYFFGADKFGICYAPDESLDAYRAYYPKYTFYPLSEYTG